MIGKEKKLFDTRTGRELITHAPHSGFKWQDGMVLRSLTPEESHDHSKKMALIGGDAFEWIPKEEVEIEER